MRASRFVVAITWGLLLASTLAGCPSPSVETQSPQPAEGEPRIAAQEQMPQSAPQAVQAPQGQPTLLNVLGGVALLAPQEAIVTAFVPNSNTLLSGGGRSPEEVVLVWDLDTGAIVGTLPGAEDHVSALTVSADGARAAGSTIGRTVSVWDLSTRTLLRTITSSETTYGIALSANGALLCVGGDEGTLAIWDLETGSERVLHHAPDAFSDEAHV